MRGDPKRSSLHLLTAKEHKWLDPSLSSGNTATYQPGTPTITAIISNAGLPRVARARRARLTRQSVPLPTAGDFRISATEFLLFCYADQVVLSRPDTYHVVPNELGPTSTVKAR